MIHSEIKIQELSLHQGDKSPCKIFGQAATLVNFERFKRIWRNCRDDFSLLLFLAGSLTAEVDGISEAGATPESRRYTALADAELLLIGPKSKPKFHLPPLIAGVSPALISYVASRFIGVKPLVAAAGLFQMPDFPCLMVESENNGPAQCISTGKAMDSQRVQYLWGRGLQIGLKLTKPLLLAECVPGGTTTAQAVMTGMGMSVNNLISGSSKNLPVQIKTDLVNKALRTAGIVCEHSPEKLLSAVGDPFQAFAVGLILGARKAGQPVLLGGGSQMLAVISLALASIDNSLRSEFVSDIAIGTTSWLLEETSCKSDSQSSFASLINVVEDFFDVGILGIATGLSFEGSPFKELSDYECGYIKEGVGAGALALIAQMNGISCTQIRHGCELALEDLKLTK